MLMSANEIERAQAILSGLDEARQVIAGSVLATIAEAHTTPGDAFGHVLGIRIEALQVDDCVVSLDVRPHMLNPHGIAQGGVTYSLADYACGVAAFVRLGSANLVTQDMHLRYHGPARLGRLTARAQVLHKGTRTLTVTAVVQQNNTLIASASATFAILSVEEVMALA